MSACEFLLLILFAAQVQISDSQGPYYAPRTANKCFSVAGVPKLDFNQCQEDEMILVKSAMQGISRELGQCSYRKGDCTEPTTSETDNKLHRQCIGHSKCQITVSVAWMSRCSAYSTYNYVRYQCIPKTDVVNICDRVERKVFRSGFIASPSYPNKYNNNIQCYCEIDTELNQKILLKFPDSALEWSHNCRKDIIRITDRKEEMQRCGKLPRNYNITSKGNKLHVLFKTDLTKNQKGFWIQLEALAAMRISCRALKAPQTTTLPPPTTTTKRTTTTTQTTSTMSTLPKTETEESNVFVVTDIYPEPPSLQNNTSKAEHSNNESHKASLAGIIIAAVLVFAIIVVLAVLTIRYKRKRHKERISKTPRQQIHIINNHTGPGIGGRSPRMPANQNNHSTTETQTNDNNHKT